MAAVMFAKISHPKPQVAKVDVDYDKTTIGDLHKLGMAALKLGSREQDYVLHSIAAYQQDVLSISSLRSSDTLSQAKIPKKCSLYFSCTRIQPAQPAHTHLLQGMGTEEAEGEAEGLEVAQDGKKVEVVGLTVDSAFQKLASTRGAERKAVLEFIDKNAKKLLESKSFVSQEEKVLVELVKRETFAINESKLLELLVVWTKHKSGRKLDAFKPHLRFGLFAVKDIASQVLPLGILSQKESLTLFTYASQVQAGKKDAVLSGFPEIATQKRSVSLDVFTWFMETPMEGVVAEEEGIFLISQPFRGQNTTVRTTQGFSREEGGIHTYELDIVDMRSNTSFRAGLVTRDYTQWQESGWAIGNRSDGTSCGFYSGTMNAGGMGSTSGSAPSFNAGTTLRFQFDTEKMIWRYGLTRSSWSGYFTITRNQEQTFYPAVTFYDSSNRTSVRIRRVDNPDS